MLELDKDIKNYNCMQYFQKLRVMEEILKNIPAGFLQSKTTVL